MNADLAALPDDNATLQAALVVARAEAAAALAQCSHDQALIAHLKLEIAKLKRDRFGPRSERTARLLEQMELQLEELEASATEDELAAEKAAAQAGVQAGADKTTNVAAFSRKRPARKPFPTHLPRERKVEPSPAACACCGGTRLAKLGEDVTETLEVIPRSWKVIQTVRAWAAKRTKVNLPGLRGHQPAAGAVPRHPPRLGRSQSAGDAAVREIRPASAAEPSGGPLRPRRRPA